MNSASSSLLVRGGIIALAMVSIILIGLHTLASIDALDWNNWAFFEWLINYQSGFIRRGLAGELIHRLGFGYEIYWINCLVFLLGSALVVLLAAVALRIGTTDVKAALLYALAPTGYFWMALSNQFYYRKEVLFYLAILGSALLYLTWRRNPRHSTAWGILGLIGVSSLILPFIHEAYPFFCLLYFFLLARAVVSHYLSEGATRWILRAFVAQNLLLFVALSWFKGSVEQSTLIWSSLSPAAQGLADPNGLHGGISAIGWSVFKEVALAVITLASGMGMYNLFALLMVYLIVGYLFAAVSGKAPAEAYRDRGFNTTFVAVVSSFLPLFAMGGDWGRWVVGIFIVSSTMVVGGLFVEIRRLPAFFERFTSPRALGTLFFLALFGLSLITRVPECCISGSGDSYYHNRFVSAIQKRLSGEVEQAPQLSGQPGNP